jgi:hypothetical protein
MKEKHARNWKWIQWKKGGDYYWIQIEAQASAKTFGRFKHFFYSELTQKGHFIITTEKRRELTIEARTSVSCRKLYTCARLVSLPLSNVRKGDPVTSACADVSFFKAIRKKTAGG